MQNANVFTVPIRSENDIFISLHYVRLMMNQLAFSEIDKQKLLVSVSELTRNILDHANATGSFTCKTIDKKGIEIIVEDRGQGIDRLDEILNGEYSPYNNGLGLGLAGAKRLMDEFYVTTSKEGTKIVAIKWRKK